MTRALSGGMLALLLLVGAAPAHGDNAFGRARLVRQISADPFAGVGGSQADTQVEPHIAVDPSNPSVVVAVFQQGRFPAGGSADPGFSTSHDGGRTWVPGNLPGLTVAVGGPFEAASDPVVAIGPDGAVYAQTIAFNDSICRSSVVVQRSDDGGVTFGTPVLAQDETSCSPFAFNDKNWIAVDMFPTSPHYGRVYSAWDRIPDLTGITQPAVLRYSDDRGETWSALIGVSSASAATIGTIPLVHPNGDLTVVYNSILAGLLQVSQTSHDGGSTFDPPVTIAAFQGIAVAGMRTGDFLPAAAVDPVSGHLYAVWQDARFRSDGLNDIVINVSTDGGASWGPVRAVNASAAHPVNHFTPAVGAHGGTVLVSYMTRANDDDRVDVRYVASTDDGASFGPDRRLGGAGNLRFAATSSGLSFLGDYMGLAVSATAAHAVWCRPSRPRRGAPADQHQTTWSATIAR